ncbi:MAG: GldG family protein [Methylosarcina sp.]
MKITRHLHQRLRFKNFLVTLALLCLLGGLAWLSTRYPLQADITQNASNTLSPASQKLLSTLPGPVAITGYIQKGQPIRLQMAQLVGRYSRHKKNISLSFVDPDTQPDKTRELNIGKEGLVLVEYQGRTEKLSFIDESSLTNALLQLAKAEDRWVTFLTGHGERSPEGQANFDYGQFGKELSRRKISSQTINLATIPAIPDNSSLLVLSAPSVPLLAGEVDIIKSYLQRGGNLLLLSDPGNLRFESLLPYLGLKQMPGTLVDAAANLYKITDPTFIIASEYTQHPITRSFQLISLFPAAAGFEVGEETEFLNEPLLDSSPKSWTETGPLTGKISFEPGNNERQGPVAFAYALTRDLNPKTQQRVVVVGDGDFLANAYIGNVGNLDLGLRMINWLVHDDRFIDIPAKIAPDKTLQLTQTSVAVIGFGFLIVLPLLLAGTGFFIWRKRRRR